MQLPKRCEDAVFECQQRFSTHCATVVSVGWTRVDAAGDGQQQQRHDPYGVNQVRGPQRIHLDRKGNVAAEDEPVFGQANHTQLHTTARHSAIDGDVVHDEVEWLLIQ